MELDRMLFLLCFYLRLLLQKVRLNSAKGQTEFNLDSLYRTVVQLLTEMLH